MTFIDRLRFLINGKSSQARIALSINQVGQPISSPRTYASFTKEGYQKNVIVYRCVSMIARAVAGIDWELYNKRQGATNEIEEHPILTLLKRPNPTQAQSQFFEALASYYALTGNTFVEAARFNNQPPLELWTMRPDLMQIVPNKEGYIGKYIFRAGSVEKVFEADVVTMRSNVMHIKTFNPLDIFFGMSPLEAAMMSLDQNNRANQWNLSLLQNSAVPSGVLQVLKSDANPDGSVSEEQFNRIKSELDSGYAGSSKAGRPMVLEGGMEWKQISMSPKDMEFLNNKNITSIDICQAFGVPPEMVGLGQKTFNNYKEARKSFYQETVLPIMDTIETELNAWLLPMFDKTGNLYICYDKDDIEALQIDRESKFTMANGANYLTQNEKREAVGYERMDGWDVFLIGNQLLEVPDTTEDVVEEIPPEKPAAEDGQEESVPQESEEPNDTPKGFKSFNLLNNNEKQSSWRKQNAQRKRLEAAFNRDLQSDFKEMSKDVAKALKTSSDPKVLEFALFKTVDKNMVHVKGTLNRHIKYAIEEFGQQTFSNAKSAFKTIETKAKKAEMQWEDWAKSYLKKRVNGAVEQIEGTTKKQIKRILTRVEEGIIEGDTIEEMSKDISAEFSNLGISRSRLIARTETASASTNSSLEAVKTLGVPNMYKEWISSEDDRVRDGGNDGNSPDHAAMNGVEVPLEEKFTVPPDTDMDGPLDMSAGADQVCNCRCVLVFKSKNTEDI